MSRIRTSQNLCNECGGENPRCDWCKGTGDEVFGALNLMADLAGTPGNQGAQRVDDAAPPNTQEQES